MFTGLAIHDQWDWSRRFPVLRLSFGGGVVVNRADLQQLLHKQLEKHEFQFALAARYPDLGSRFIDLIERLCAQTGQRRRPGHRA